ncbi:MAG: hypothetical protein PVF74_12045 [Anaerolineales bacterium]
MKRIFVAPGPNELATTSNPEGIVAGFWQGLWHGFTTPVTFLMSLFKPDVTIYEVHNNGGWYNFGYLIGLSVIFGGGSADKWAKPPKRESLGGSVPLERD